MNVLPVPPKPLETVMTDSHRRLLCRVVAEGAQGIHSSKCKLGTVKGLLNRHLIQGRQDNGAMIIATPAGLAAVRMMAGEDLNV